MRFSHRGRFILCSCGLTTPSNVTGAYQRFGDTYRLHIQDRNDVIILKDIKKLATHYITAVDTLYTARVHKVPVYFLKGNSYKNNQSLTHGNSSDLDTHSPGKSQTV